MQTAPILITGASGFVGQHLLARLVLSGRRIVALHHRPLAQELRARFGDAVSWRSADIAAADLTEILNGIGTVFHLAAHVSQSEATGEVAEMMRTNVLGARRLAQQSKLAGVRRFILISSVAACEYASSADIDEANGLPRSSYGRSKRQAEDAVLSFQDATFGVTVLRPAALFGEHHLGSVFEFVKAIGQGRFAIIGSGANRTNFYYVGDFVELLLAVEHEPRAIGETFIASDEPQSVERVARAIATLLESQRSIWRIPRWLGYCAGYGCDVLAAITRRPWPLSVRRVRAMTRDVAYRNDKLRQVLGYQASHGLFEGLRRSIQWYRQAGLL